MGYYRPIDLAKKLKVSTSLVRQYEEKELIPASERSESGYRLYTEKHLQYLICVRKLQAGFGSEDIKLLMESMMRGDLKMALILSNEKQARLFEKIQHAKKTAKAFKDKDIFTDVLKVKSKLNIKEAAKLTGVVDTTLRHWEVEGLLQPERNTENGYRLYDKESIAKILIIKTVKSAVWSLDEVRDFLFDFNYENYTHIQNLAQQALNYLYDLNVYQHQGVAALYQLALELEYVEEEYRPDYTFNIPL